MHVGFWLMFGCAVASIIHNQRLIRRLRRAEKNLQKAEAVIAEELSLRSEIIMSRMSQAHVEERTEPLPHFAVYRMGISEKIDVLYVGFNPNDPDDKEYKRIFAEERAEMLNEKP